MKNKLLLAFLLSTTTLPAWATEPANSHSPGQYAQAQDEHERISPEQRLDGLKTKLQITPKQMDAWNVYAETVKKNASDRRAQFEQHKKEGHVAWNALSAPERISKRLEFMKTEQQHMQTELDALKTLYAQLTPPQQTTLNTAMQGRDKIQHNR